VAKAFENRIGSGGDWHRTLLLRMSEPVPGLRPALLSEELFDAMNRLRGFRHFVRHAYLTEIDPAGVSSVWGKGQSEMLAPKEKGHQSGHWPKPA
jgi:hypothetical protein